MKKENLSKAKDIHTFIGDCESFISQCDYVIRNARNDNELPLMDRFFRFAIEEGVITKKDLVTIITGLRDIATVKLQDLDKQLEAL